MTKVMVVGADIQCERALLERLRAWAGGQRQSRGVRACRAVEECDVLLLARDSAALRRVVQSMARRRPGIPVWIEDEDGQLHDGRDPAAPALASTEIQAVLAGQVDDASSRSASAAPFGLRRSLAQYLALLPWNRTA